MSLMEKAKGVLRSNDIDGNSTKPSPELYPHQWFWDSCFIAIGYSRFDPDRAKKEVYGILEGQWPNGLIPHIRFNPKAKNYFPAAEDWGVPVDKLTSGIIQPPLLATAVWEIYQQHEDVKFLRRVFPGLLKYHEYLFTKRGGDLIFIIHPWESGMDDSPLFDRALAKVPETDKHFQRSDVKTVNKKQRPTDAEYHRYISLLELFKVHQYDEKKIAKETKFLIQDVLVNSVWAKANLDLSRIADEVGNPEAAERYLTISVHTKRAMNQKMFKDAYYDYDLYSKALIKKKGPNVFLPLYGAVANADQAKKIAQELDHFIPKHGLTTIDIKTKDFENERYWRGPVWININWFVIKGLLDYGYLKEAEKLKKITLELVENQGFYEYFDPISGIGYGTDSFSWTAALVIDLLETK